MSFRRALCSIMLLLSASLPLRAAPRVAPRHCVLPSPPATFLVGGDVSFLARIEALGGVYRDKGQPRDLLQMFKARGANLIRLRLWVKPDGRDMNVSDLPTTLALARRVKEAGLQLLLDLHYSDSWADPAQQTKPAAWKELSFEQLTQRVESYSRWVVAQFRKQGTPPGIVQIGNETPNGMLWPEGHVEEPGGWERYAALIKAGIRGVKAGSVPLAPPQIMLHLNNGAEAGLAQWFFANLKPQERGISFDLLGLSFYPGPTTRLAQLKSALALDAARFGKPIVVVETGYPFGGVPETEQAQWEFPPSPAGQKAFLAALIATVRQTPQGLGRGVVWWAPEWVPIEGLGHFYGDKMLFDRSFNALPALDELSATAPLSFP